MFSVALVTEPFEHWIATCDKCGMQLDVSDRPFTIINIKDHIPPAQLQKVRNAIYEHIRVTPDMPIIMNVDELQVERVLIDMKSRLREHAASCSKESA
jgi:hypothetical protein